MKNYLILGLCLLLLLSACASKQDAPPAEPSSKETQAPETPTNSSPPSTLHIALWDASSASPLPLLNSEALPLTTTDVHTEEAAGKQLLDARVDLALLSPQAAANLYRAGEDVQVIAVLSAWDASSPNDLDCLVATTSTLAAKQTEISQLLLAYAETEEEHFLATAWDMVDLVQQSLELQYEANPTPAYSVPDGNFFYLPTA